MSLLTRISAGFRSLGNRDRERRELDDELQHYIDQAAAANRARGMSGDEAMRVARASVGSMAAAQEPARVWGWDATLAAFLQDVRYAARYLIKSPGFTIAAVLSLALGIGANTAIFSMINATLIRRMPIANSERVVTIASPSGSGVYSYPAFVDVRDASTGFTGITAYGSIQVSLSDDEATDLVTGSIVTGNFFDVLGVQPAHGRLLTPDDDRTPGAHPAAVISHRLWRNRFGGRADIIGLDVRLNGQPYTIIGVTPKGFTGAEPGQVSDLFVPIMMQAWMRPPRSGYTGDMDPDLLRTRGNAWLYAFGRLADGVSIDQATASLNAVVRGMDDWRRARAGDPAPSVTLSPIEEGPPGQRAEIMSVARLLAAVVLAVLVIACANVANLLLGRAAARRKEIAVRLAIGATRRRLIRQLLTESVLLATVGGAAGLAIAWLAIVAIRTAPPPSGALPVTLDFAIDLRVLVFTFGLSVVTGILFGLIPALQASRPQLVPALKDQAAGFKRRGRLSARNALVVTQVALSFVLLVSAGLLIRSVERVRSIAPGFDVDHLLTVPLNIQLLRYTRDQGQTLYREVVERVEGIPGVTSATLVRWVPLSGGGSRGNLFVEGTAAPTANAGNPVPVLSDVVGTRFFETAGIRIVRGRAFDESDTENSPRVTVVNELFAQRHFPNENPIGRRLRLGRPDGPAMEIIGVAANAKYVSLDEQPTPIVYTAASQHPSNGMTLMVRTSVPPSSLAGAIGREVHALDRSLPLAGVRTLEEWIGRSIYMARAGATLLTAFGALALLLAAVGLYGVLAYAVSLRTREFGLRMALGARAPQVLRDVLGEGALLVCIGVAAGLVAAWSATRLIARFLYNISPTDITTFAAVPLVMGIVALLACLLPALRATRVDPIRALRE